MTKNICSVCGKPFEYSLSVANGKCVHDSPVGGKKRDMGQLRRDNASATQEAQRMANEARRQDAINDPMVKLPDIQGAGKYGGNISVKKSILDKIAAKDPGLTE